MIPGGNRADMNITVIITNNYPRLLYKEMNKNLQLIAFLVTIINLPALPQYANGIYKLVYSDSSGEKGTTTYIYKGKDLPNKAIWQLDDGSRWSVNYHRFDSAGNLVERYREFSDSIRTIQSFIYNDDHQLVQETFNRSDGIKGSAVYLYKNGACIKAICNLHNGWFTGIINYSNDEKGKPESATIERDGAIIGMVTYTKDTLGRVIIETWSFNSGLKQEYKYSYIDDLSPTGVSSTIFLIPSGTFFPEEENYELPGEGVGHSC